MDRPGPEWLREWLDEPRAPQRPQAPAAHGSHREVRHPRYDPRCYLQGVITEAWAQAAETHQAAHVHGTWPAISLYPDSQVAVVEGGEDALRAFAAREDASMQAQLVFSPAPRFQVNHPQAVAIDVLMWKLALGASRGRLPVDAPLDTPCSMPAWPNFTRLLVTPGAMAVTALWIQQPCTLRQTIERLTLTPSDVFAFYSAAAALGLVHHEDRPPAALIPSPAAPARTRRGLLRTLFDKLRSN